MSTLQNALDYLAAGLSVIPVYLDTTKRPALTSWKQYQNALATVADAEQWFADGKFGIGLPCGRVSGGLEVLDFDCGELLEPWRSQIPPKLFAKLIVIETPSLGAHVLYRCREIYGNTVIAHWERGRLQALKQARRTPAAIYTDLSNLDFRLTDAKPRIETRGEGGFIVACGNPLEIHAAGLPYIQQSGPPMPDVQTITPDERRTLWGAAKTFDCRPARSAKVDGAVKRLKRELWKQRTATRPTGQDVTPWDDFDNRASWHDILEPHGWQDMGAGVWCRPGKSVGTSASVGANDQGVEVLTVFSSSAGVLSDDAQADGFSRWGKFRAYTALYHAGDGSAAGKAIHERGYGSRRATA